MKRSSSKEATMEIDALRAFNHITGPLSPSAEQAVARAKTIAQRAFPDGHATKAAARRLLPDDLADSFQIRGDKTSVALDIEPAANLVIARVFDRDTGDVIDQIPSAASVRLATLSREMLRYGDADAEAQPVSTIHMTV
jgi:uncharacterized FlaG/YvyC family protein